MGKHGVALIFIFIVLFAGFSSVSAEAPVIIVSRFVSTALSPLIKWLWSLKSSNTKTAISGRSMVKFESGYNVETVFDGSKLGIEPYSVEVLPTGEVLVLDSASSDLYKISQPLSRYSRPKLIAGSADGYSGHVDGKPREARMSNPKGLTVDDRGNIYIADTTNMVIRKISDTGVTTIAGGNWGRGGGHVDGPSEDAKFSTDFDVFYVGSSCSLLVIDRGNQAIREIQLQDDDCANEYETDFPLGIVVLAAAVFFGYMLALLQRRVGSLFYSQRQLLELCIIIYRPYKLTLEVRPAGFLLIGRSFFVLVCKIICVIVNGNAIAELKFENRTTYLCILDVVDRSCGEAVVCIPHEIVEKKIGCSAQQVYEAFHSESNFIEYQVGQFSGYNARRDEQKVSCSGFPLVGCQPSKNNFTFLLN
ncbi:hypothetical protein MKX03_002772 [Papaver bracteatum]|nr:hypothetical protein MKX03_002772 [Papaver bracteatum]